MLVVSVRGMRMLVRSGVMAVKVAMRADDKGLMLVMVMLIVVTMAMLVLEGPMSVPVPMSFR